MPPDLTAESAAKIIGAYTDDQGKSAKVEAFRLQQWEKENREDDISSIVHEREEGVTRNSHLVRE